MAKKRGKDIKVDKIQTIRLTRAAALQAVARVIIDFQDMESLVVADLSRKIVNSLGFR